MTIFRFSAAWIGLLVAGCGSAVGGRPDANTPLGRITRIGDFRSASIALKGFTEARLSNPVALKAEFLQAGFVASKFADEKGVECQSYTWTSDDIFPVVMLANICGQDVSTNAGQLAP